MIEYISLAEKEKKVKETTFTHRLTPKKTWIRGGPLNHFKKIIYLGECEKDGDMFVCYHEDNTINIYRGIKGDEF